MNVAFPEGPTEAGVMVVNGLRLAPIDVPSAGDASALHGYYQCESRGVLLLDKSRVPQAFACSNGGTGFLVTAHHTPEGRVRYMFALAGYTAEWLGLEGYGQKVEAAKSFLRQAKAIQGIAPPAPAPVAADDEPEGLHP